MQAGAIVVIWTLASELSTPGTNALTGAAAEALGPDTQVRLAVAPDPEGMRLDDARDASAVVRITWDEAEHRRARLLCFFRDSKRFVDREVVFESSDPERERGRTLGFLLASMLLDASVRAPADPTAAPREQPEAPHKDAASETARSSASTAPRTALLGAAEFASAGSVVGYGFWFAVERTLGSQRFWLGGSAHARFGSIEHAQASSRVIGLGLQASWLALRAGPVWAGARFGCSVAQLRAARGTESSSGGSQTQSRILPSAEVLVHGGYRFSPASALSLQLGTELLPGTTEIYVGDSHLATWPWAAFLARVGVETAF